MAYDKQTWYDLPNETTPFSASRMNHIEEGIMENDISNSTNATAISTNATAIGILQNLETNEKSNLVGSINETNNKSNYVSNEQIIGEWLGERHYRKVIYIGSLPNNTNVTISHGITNLKLVTNYRLIWFDTNDNAFSCGNRVGRYDSSTVRITCTVGSSGINIQALGTDWSSRTENAYVVIEYLKNTA